LTQARSPAAQSWTTTRKQKLRGILATCAKYVQFASTELYHRYHCLVAETTRKKMHTPHLVRKVVAVPVAAVLVLLLA
jgi:hypothetical protein